MEKEGKGGSVTEGMIDWLTDLLVKQRINYEV